MLVLVLNGIQVQSAETCSLLAHLPQMKSLGVDVLRLMPQASGMEEIVRAFHAVLTGAPAGEDALASLSAFMPAGAADGYWRGAPGMSGAS